MRGTAAASETLYASLVLAKTNSFVSHSIRRRHAVPTIRAHRTTVEALRRRNGCRYNYWDLEAEYVFNGLGDSLTHWQQLLTEIKLARAKFDTTETQKVFWVCFVDNYEQVQARAKYDAWHCDILSRIRVKET
jgi:hypothetical protein